jgi:hypothetical protein
MRQTRARAKGEATTSGGRRRGAVRLGKRIAVGVALVAGTAALASVARAGTTFIWRGTGAPSVWNDPLNWLSMAGPTVYPGVGDTVEFGLDATVGTGTATFLQNSAHLTIGGASTYNRVTIYNGAIANSGLVTFQADGASNYYNPDQALVISGTTSLTGGGTIRFAGLGTGIDGQGTSLVNADNTLRGSGYLYNLHSLVNQGSILAEGGQILLGYTTIDNSGGVITIAPDGAIAMDGNSSIAGGSLQGQAGGLLTSGLYQSFASSGLLTVGGQSTWNRPIIAGTITNAGEITFAPDAVANYYNPDQALVVSGSATLAGAGTVRFTGLGTGIDGQGGTLTNASETLRGTGYLYNLHNLINHGSMIAEGGQIYLGYTTIDNTGGVITIAPDGALASDGNGRVFGGTVQGQSGGNLTSGRYGDLTTTGVLTVGGQANWNRVQIEGTITNQGEIDYQADGGNNYWSVDQALVLVGSGTITLSGGGTVRFNGAGTGIDGQGLSLLNANNTLRGPGLLYNMPGLTNQGTILVEGGQLGLNYSNLDNTAGTLTVTSGSTLNLQNATVQNTGSAITVQATGVVSMDANSYLSGGTIHADPGSLFPNGRYRNVTTTGALTVAGQSNWNRVQIEGTLTNQGEIDYQADGGNNYWPVDQALVLVGSGTATLSGGGTVRLNGAGTGIDGQGLSLVNANNTLRGPGLLYNIPSLTNQGTILVEGGQLGLNYSNLDNTAGTLTVTSGSTLNLQNATVQNTGSTISVQSTAVVSMDGNSYLSGGTIHADPGSLFPNGRYRNVTTTGVLTVAGQSNWNRVQIEGTLTNQGEIDYQADAGNNYWSVDQALLLVGSGTTTLSGSGTVRFNGAGTGIDGQGLSLNNTSNTLRGSGLLYNIPSFSNAGTIAAEGGALTFNYVTLTSTGALSVAAGATLVQGTSSNVTANAVTGPGTYGLTTGRLATPSIEGALNQTGGTFAPGVAAAGSSIGKDYLLSGGSLELTLGGTSPSQSTSLHVKGNLALTSTSTSSNVSVVASPGFQVAPGQVFNVVKVDGTRSGVFANAPANNYPVSSSLGSNLYITYAAGDGNDIALYSTLTPGSVDFAVAQPTDNAYYVGTRDAAAGSTSTIALKDLDLLPGTSFTLGPNETLDLGGTGTLTVTQGSVFSGNGTVLGNILNAGLVRIPIVQIGNISHVTGGYVNILPVTPPPPGDPVQIVLPSPTVVNGGTYVHFAGGGGGGGGGGCCGGGGGFASGSGGGISIVGDAPKVEGTLAFDASLDVTGHYEQTSTGVLRLFIGGGDAGVSYSQLRVGQQVTLDGSIQVVLQPEMFSQFRYQLRPGATFDFIKGTGGITRAPGLSYSNLVTAAGASDGVVTGLTLTPFVSSFAADPDSLVMIGENLFSFDLVESNTVLRATYIGSRSSTTPPPAVPVGPAATVLLALALVVVGAYLSRAKAAR